MKSTTQSVLIGSFLLTLSLALAACSSGGSSGANSDRSRGAGSPDSGVQPPAPPSLTDTELLSGLTDLGLRLDALRSTSLKGPEGETAVAGDEVVTWEDLSGQNIHLTHTTSYSATRPHLEVLSEGLVPAVFFDGNLDTLRGGSASPSLLPGVSGTGWSIFVVARAEKTASVGETDMWQDGGPSVLMSYGGDKDWKRIQIQMKRNAAEFNAIGSKVTSAGQEVDLDSENQFQIVAMVDRFESGQSVVTGYLNGKSVGERSSVETSILDAGVSYFSAPRDAYPLGQSLLNSPTAGWYQPRIYHNNNPAGNRGPFTLGSESKASATGRSFQGHLAEVIVMKRALTSSEVLSISEDLYRKWVSDDGFPKSAD